MTLTWLEVLKLVLTLAAFISRRVSKAEAEKAFGDALRLAIKERTDDAVAAGNAVRDGRMQPDDNDPNRRD